MKTYLELTKPRLLMLAVISSLVGFFLSSPFDWIKLVHLALGAFLIGGGANALNQYLERDLDLHMNRTKLRPIPSERLNPRSALQFGLLLAITGVAYLMTFLNTLTGWMGVLILVSYLLVYTPLKTRTIWCTLVGAIPGALPPVMGWTAASNQINSGAIILFLILFVWQLPHFFSLAWFYKDDYERGGFKMLPVIDPDGKKTAGVIIFSCFILALLSPLPTIWEMSGNIYLVGAILLSFIFLMYSVRLAQTRTAHAAKRFFLSSNGYLLAVMILMVANKL